MGNMMINCPSVTITATTTSSRVAYPNNANSFLNVRIYNAGPSVVYIKSGDSTVAAAVGDCFIAPGAIEGFTKGGYDTHIAALATSGSALLYIQVGGGE